MSDLACAVRRPGEEEVIAGIQLCTQFRRSGLEGLSNGPMELVMSKTRRSKRSAAPLSQKRKLPVRLTPCELNLSPLRAKSVPFGLTILKGLVRPAVPGPARTT